MFEISKGNRTLSKLEANVDDLATALDESADLREMIASPVISRSDHEAAVSALAEKMALIPVTRRGLGLMARKRRLFVLPHLVQHLRALLAEEKGEVTADVTAAKAMTKAQQEKLAKALKASVGKDVKINLAVDESLIGGLVVKVGSKMIDSSIRSRLNALQNSMKEVG